jgi:hypothetical protein
LNQERWSKYYLAEFLSKKKINGGCPKSDQRVGKQKVKKEKNHDWNMARTDKSTYF